jgi:hemolysin-activating ACP:hemolysin acyltransferase
MRPGPLDVFPSAPEGGRKTAIQRSRAEQLGLAVILNKKRHEDLGLILPRISAAISCGQVQFFFNDNGTVVGYIVWALLSDEVGERLRSNPHTALHISEWNEGNNLFVLDFAAPYGHIMDILMLAMTTLFFTHKKIFYARSRRGRNICVEFVRDI